MTITDIQQGELFTVRVYKTYMGRVWANTYELQAEQAASNGEAVWAQAVNDIVRLEQALHLDAVMFDRVVVSTWVPDNIPYNPQNFSSYPISLRGAKGANAPGLPLTSALFVRRDVSTGRDGKLFYRGSLDGNDIGGTMPFFTLRDSVRVSLQQQINNWFAQYHPLSGILYLVMVGVNAAGQQHVRRVLSLTVMERIVSKKLDNRWFDRRSRPNP